MVFKADSPNPSVSCLSAAIKSFLTYELPRRDRLMSYYEGSQGVNKGRVAAGRPNNTLVANWAKYITDVHTGYFMGVPPTFSFTGKRVQDRMVAALRDASFGSALYAAARDMSICGEGYTLAYLGEKGVRLARLDPRYTFVLTHGIENRIVAAVRLSASRDSVHGELYTEGSVRDLSFDGRNLELATARAQAFKQMPVSRFVNNLGQIGDFEPVTSLIDAYNVLLSGAMDDMQSVANAFLALYGMQGTTKEDIDKANISRILSLAENGRAEFVVKNLNPDAIELLKNTIIADMLMITMTPNLNDEAFGRNSSGVALEYKLWGAEQARSAKQQGFEGGMYHLISLFYEGCSLLDSPVGGPCTARFHKNLPQDLSKICANIDSLSGVISNRTKLELLPFVASVDDELKRLEAEARLDA